MRPGAGCLAAVLALALPAHANDFPTVERVEYVEACMHEHEGLRHEALYKCACAIDALAAQIPYEEYVELQTASRAISIAGERGSVVRDAPEAQAMAKRFRGMESKVRKDCFLD